MSRRMRTFGGIRSTKPTTDETPAWPALIDDKVEEEKVEAVGEREEETHHERGDLPKTFEEVGLNEDLLKSVTEMGYTEPTLIQAAAIPGLLQGDDVMGQARTGTGKTAAFCLPAIQKIDTSVPSVQAIVLCPTRELCMQVAAEVKKFSAHSGVKTVAIYGGQPMQVQLKALEDGAHFMTGTPGRVIDHLRRGTLDLSKVIYAVLDEADEMLDMGFIDDIKFILQQTPKARQTALFSATFPPTIRRLARGNMKNPRVIHTSGKRLTVESVTQIFYEVAESQKFKALCNLLDAEGVEQTVVFVRTKWETDALGKKLAGKGYRVKAIHGDLPQSARSGVMRDFRAGTIDIMVATDVAARGLDIPAVSHVFNYHLPQDPEVYVHRIGRTARMGAKGFAVSLIDPKDYHQLVDIQDRADVTIEQRQLPDAGEIEGRRRLKFAKEIAGSLSAEGLDDYLEGAKLIVEAGPDVAVLAAHYLKAAYEEKFPKKEALTVESFGNTGAESGFVRLHINLGRDHDIKPGDLVKTFASAGGISGDKVGRIDIFDHFSFVQIPTDMAVEVVQGLEDHIYEDIKLVVSPAKPRSRERSEPREGRDGERPRSNRFEGSKDRSRRGGRDRDKDGDRDRSRRRRRGPDSESKPKAEGGAKPEAKADAPAASAEGAKTDGGNPGTGESGDAKPKRRRRRRRGRKPGEGGEGDAPMAYQVRDRKDADAPKAKVGESSAPKSDGGGDSPAPAPPAPSAE